MRRRDVLSLLGGSAVTWPVAAQAQRSSMRRIGVLTSATAGGQDTLVRDAAFRATLATLGWEAGRTVKIEYRWGVSGTIHARALAAELLRLSPDVIFAQGSLAAEAVRQQTRVTPVVFVGVSDPVSSGLVASMAHPGENLTGFTNFELSIGAKWLEMLREMAPDIKRVLVMLTPGDSGNAALLQAIEIAAPGFGVQPVAAGVANAEDAGRAIVAFAGEAGGGLLVLPGAPRRENRNTLIDLAMRYRLPAIYPLRLFVADGGLMSYDTDIVDLYRRGAAYVDRILRGEKPGELPVQYPTKYELVINLKTAKAQGLTVPTGLLVRADEVIE